MAVWLKNAMGQSQRFNSADEMRNFIQSRNIPPEQLKFYSITGATGADANAFPSINVSGPIPANNYFNPQVTGQQPSQPAQPPTPTTPTTPPPSQPVNPVNPDVPLSTPTTPVNQPVAPSDINPYIPNASSQQQSITQQALDQSRGNATQNVAALNDLYAKNIQSQMQNWTDPNSAAYQSSMGQLNNFGRADANTFGQSLSSRLAPLISDSLTRSSEGALIPSFQNQQDLIGTGAGVQSNLGLAPLQRYMQQQDFDKQAALANQLADKGQPSNTQNAIGMGSSILGGLGNLGQGATGLKDLAHTWLCTHLKNLGLATIEEVEAVHAKLRPSIFRHPLSWIHYVYSAPELLRVSDREGACWREIKKVLIDEVLVAPDSESAFQIYRAEVKRLALRYAPILWKWEVC